MMFSIDPLRRSSGASRSRKAQDETDQADLTQETGANLLPVPVGPARTISSGAPRVAGASAIDAQVMGERRGLRAGYDIHGRAAGSYNRTEWSGAYDRRAPKGRVARTAI